MAKGMNHLPKTARQAGVAFAGRNARRLSQGSIASAKQRRPQPMMATSVNRNVPRHVTTISLRMLEIAWKPISGRNRAKAISAVSPASRNAAATGFGAFVTSVMSDLLDVRAAEQALRQED